MRKEVFNICEQLKTGKSEEAVLNLESKSSVTSVRQYVSFFNKNNNTSLSCHVRGNKVVVYVKDKQ